MKIALLIPIMAILSGLALLVGAVVSTDAGHHGYTMFSASIEEIDTDGDGVISFDEFAALHAEQLRWSFNALDSDKDKTISAEEWNTFIKMHGAGGS